jgi:competence protein ComEA
MKLFALVALSVSLLFGAVDINTANKTELMTLNGVGEKKADLILAYRTANCFKSVDGLTNVKGIGTKFIEKNKENLTVSPCKKK